MLTMNCHENDKKEIIWKKSCHGSACDTVLLISLERLRKTRHLSIWGLWPEYKAGVPAPLDLDVRGQEGKLQVGMAEILLGSEVDRTGSWSC
jgi:hypothetical protein